MKRSALTLVEVLVSLALAALLAIAVQALVVNAYRVSRQIEHENSERTRLTLPLEFLRQDLAAAATCGDVEVRGQSLTFATLNSFNPDCRSIRHFVDVRYWMTADALRRSEREPGQVWSGGTVIAREIETFKVAIFDGLTWQSDWPPSNFRPALGLRIRVTSKHAPDQTMTVPLGPLGWNAYR